MPDLYPSKTRPYRMKQHYAATLRKQQLQYDIMPGSILYVYSTNVAHSQSYTPAYIIIWDAAAIARDDRRLIGQEEKIKRERTRTCLRQGIFIASLHLVKPDVFRQKIDNLFIFFVSFFYLFIFLQHFAPFSFGYI